MDVLSVVLIAFGTLELLNVLTLYLAPGSRRGNALGVFRAYERSKRDPEVHALVSYLIDWVAGTKLIFIVLLIGILITGLARDQGVQRHRPDLLDPDLLLAALPGHHADGPGGADRAAGLLADAGRDDRRVRGRLRRRRRRLPRGVRRRMRLSPDTVRELWSRTYNTSGKPDWSHIFPYYRDDVVFQDAIQRVEGRADFEALCNRLAKRCRELRMHIVDVSQTGDVIFLEWEMTLMFERYPSSTLYGCTKLTLDDDGLIVRQRDYYDLWGDIFDNIPRFAKRLPPLHAPEVRVGRVPLPEAVRDGRHARHAAQPARAAPADDGVAGGQDGRDRRRHLRRRAGRRPRGRALRRAPGAAGAQRGEGARP
jgi:ketosteroid isomerase-like protein